MIILDSNILINASKPEGVFLRDFILSELHGCSVVSYVEVFGYSQLSGIERSDLEYFFSFLEMFPVDETVARLAAEIRNSKKIKTPDALIAATVLVSKSVLMTYNRADFLGIKGLQIINPNDLR